MLPLFDDPPSFNRQALAAKLRALAARNIWIGTSSWKYEGWCGQIYSRDRYTTRGRFSQKRFESECLAEYAETFPIVCGDFSFYQFPAPEFWQRLFARAPRLHFALKVPEDITVREFPAHARYGPRAGEENPNFLSAEMFRASFTDVLAPYRHRLGPLILEFGTFGKRHFEDAEQFARALDPFLAALPPGFRYAVEVRNVEFLQPAYFDCLRRHNVAHVFNAWTRMPELSVQTRIRDAYTADFTVTRALLRKGRDYEHAVERFSPYDRAQDENPDARRAMRELIQQAREKRRAAYMFVNNRLEGNAPVTIEAVVGED
jgi:uncharacterized protein YecE (DUF72 family)